MHGSHGTWVTGVYAGVHISRGQGVFIRALPGVSTVSHTMGLVASLQSQDAGSIPGLGTPHAEEQPKKKKEKKPQTKDNHFKMPKLNKQAFNC